MNSIVITAIWAAVTVYLLIRLEKGFRDWLTSRAPLAQQQVDGLSKRIDDLQNQVSRLSIDKDFT